MTLDRFPVPAFGLAASGGNDLTAQSGWLTAAFGVVSRPAAAFVAARAPTGDRRGCFAVLSDDGGQLGVELVRVDYPAEQVAAEMREVGLPDELADKVVAAA